MRVPKGPRPRPRPRSRRSLKRPSNYTRRSVLKMLAAMEQTPDSSCNPLADFLTTGRTGRRNAIADLDEHATTSSGDLPEQLERLSTTDPPANQGPSTSGACGGTSQRAGAGAAAAGTSSSAGASGGGAEPQATGEGGRDTKEGAR